MERPETRAAMAEVGQLGIRSAFDGIVAATAKRRQGPQRVIDDMVSVEIARKQA